MKQITIERFAYTPMGTFGRMIHKDQFVCWTLEEVWNNNERGRSCIPIGPYVIKRGFFPKHKECFEVTNVPGRSAILIHTGNTILDIEGCIIPGDKLGWHAGLWAIAPGTSKPAYDKFMDILKGEDTALISIINDLNQGIVT